MALVYKYCGEDMDNNICENYNKFSSFMNKKIVKIADGLNKKDKIIYDGVAFPQNYIDSNSKIMWVLKEPYESHNVYGWQVGKIYKPNNIKAYIVQLIATVSYNIINIENGITKYHINKKEMLEALQCISWINLNKIAAKKRSRKDLSDIYKIWKEVLLEQIKFYNPDIIICGNTLQYFSNDILFRDGERKKINIGNHNYYIYNNKIYINVYHPSHPFSKKQYINEIIEAIKYWKNI
jgi:hypothetical protein